MCGICGFINFDGEIASYDILVKMNNALVHRGPDDEGFKVEGPVAMGMRRLSIIDVNGGHQPISNEDGSIITVFNGEIYNSPDLRIQLEKKGHKFSTRTDTETIVHGYEQFGDDCPNVLRGMFAFFLIDKRCNGSNKTTKYILVRDRLGIKPLFYYLDEKRLVFSSELTSLLQHPEILREIEPKALYQYMATGIVSAPLTMFKNVRQVMPGQMLIIKNNQVSFKTYWSIPDPENIKYNNVDAANHVRKLLEESVQEHLLSDVPVGAFLSGGIDSSAIVALMALHSNKRIKTFSIKFDEDGYDESIYSRMIAKKYNTDHQEFTLKNHGFNRSLLQSVISYHGQPTADSSAIPTFIVSSLASNNVKVVLSGDGGDECFAGYAHYGWLNKITKIYHVPKVLRKIFGYILYNIAKIPFFKNISIIRQIINAIDVSMSPFSNIPFNVLRINRDDEIKKILNKKWVTDSTDDALFSFMKDLKGDPISKGQRFSFRYFLPDAYLPKVDRMSMAHSLEVRVPFLDHRLVEFALKLPGNIHWKNGRGKQILRKALADLLPSEIFKHKKQGFSIPLHNWADGEYFDYVENILSKEAVNKRGIFKYDEILRLLEECKNKKNLNRSLISYYRSSHRLFMIVVFEMWCCMYIDNLITQPIYTDLSEMIHHGR